MIAARPGRVHQPGRLNPHNFLTKSSRSYGSMADLEDQTDDRAKNLFADEPGC
jgi:hypothetical protein